MQRAVRGEVTAYGLQVQVWAEPSVQRLGKFRIVLGDRQRERLLVRRDAGIEARAGLVRIERDVVGLESDIREHERGKPFGGRHALLDPDPRLRRVVLVKGGQHSGHDVQILEARALVYHAFARPGRKPVRQVEIVDPVLLVPFAVDADPVAQERVEIVPPHRQRRPAADQGALVVSADVAHVHAQVVPIALSGHDPFPFACGRGRRGTRSRPAAAPDGTIVLPPEGSDGTRCLQENG